MAENIELLERREVAERLRMSIQTVDRRIKDGTLPSVTIGRRVLVPAAQLEKFIARGGERRK